MSPTTLPRPSRPAGAGPAELALARLAATGTCDGTFNAPAGPPLDAAVDLAELVRDNSFLAKLAVLARGRASLNDLSAALLLVLARRDPALFRRAFARVVDGAPALGAVFRLLRSGRFGRKGLSHALQRAFQRWLNEAPVGALLSASAGEGPSLRDVLRLARPTPPDNARRALFGWLTGKPVACWAPAGRADLPAEVLELELFRAAATQEAQLALLPRLRCPLGLLADRARGPLVWQALAARMGPEALRLSLETFARHGAFAWPEVTASVAARLGDEAELCREGELPYQYLTASLEAEAVPTVVRAALERAAHLAGDNVPELPGPVLIGVDVSGSMSAPQGAGALPRPGKVRCLDAAALFALVLYRRNPGSALIPFATRAYDLVPEPGETVRGLAARLARHGGEGSDCSVPLAEANRRLRHRPFAGCVLLSDCESWVAPGRPGTAGLLAQWERFRGGAPRAGGPKLVCIDLRPGGPAPAPGRADVLNVGGFSDAVFEVVAGFLRDEGGLREVETVELD